MHLHKVGREGTTTILYVGIDVSKDKSDICIKDQSGNHLIQQFKIANTKADLGKLYETIERIKSKTQGNSYVVFGMEATGIYSLLLKLLVYLHFIALQKSCMYNGNDLKNMMR